MTSESVNVADWRPMITVHCVWYGEHLAEVD